MKKIDLYEGIILASAGSLIISPFTNLPVLVDSFYLGAGFGVTGWINKRVKPSTATRLALGAAIAATGASMLANAHENVENRAVGEVLVASGFNLLLTGLLGLIPSKNSSRPRK